MVNILLPYLYGSVLSFPLAASSNLLINVNHALPDVQRLGVNPITDDKKTDKQNNTSIMNAIFDYPYHEAFEDGNRELCRQFPMWTKSSEYDDDFDWMCRATMKYDPPSIELLAEEAVVGNYRYYEPWADQGRSCILYGLDQTNRNKTADDEIPIKHSKIEAVYNNSNGLPILAVVSNVLSEEEALVLKQLSMCARLDHPDVLMHRPFYDSKNDISGGNDVVFLQGYLQLLTPGIAARIQEVTKLVWEQVGWRNIGEGNGGEEYQDPSLCGIRTTEHLSYDNWRSLGVHTDSGSLYTTLIALSSTSHYDGGNFFFHPNNENSERIEIRPERHSALIFLSETSHGVSDVLSKGRQMFTTEFWKHGDTFIRMGRPDPMDLLSFQKCGTED